MNRSVFPIMAGILAGDDTALRIADAQRDPRNRKMIERARHDHRMAVAAALALDEADRVRAVEARDAREREQMAKRAENRLAGQIARYGRVVRAAGTGDERIAPLAASMWIGHVVDGIDESGAEHVGKTAACGAVVGEVAPGLGAWTFTRDDAGANIRGPKPRMSVDVVACPDCLRTKASNERVDDHVPGELTPENATVVGPTP